MTNSSGLEREMSKWAFFKPIDAKYQGIFPAQNVLSANKKKHMDTISGQVCSRTGMGTSQTPYPSAYHFLSGDVVRL